MHCRMSPNLCRLKIVPCFIQLAYTFGTHMFRSLKSQQSCNLCKTVSVLSAPETFGPAGRASGLPSRPTQAANGPTRHDHRVRDRTAGARAGLSPGGPGPVDAPSPAPGAFTGGSAAQAGPASACHCDPGPPATVRMAQ